MKTLQRALSATFKPAAPRQRDVHRRDRAEAKQIAQESGVEIERLAGGGFNVWPPKGREESGTPDPFPGDHYCGDWAEVLVMVRTYGAVDMVPLRQVIATARARLEAVPLSARGAHWRNAAERLAIAEDAIRHSHALARRHIDIAEPFVAKAQAGGEAALNAPQRPSPDQES